MHIPANMASRMKTTIDLAADLLRAAKEAARRERTTLRALVEEGLRAVHAPRGDAKAKPHRWKPVGFRGRGLQPGIVEGDWERIRALIYEGRGG